MKRPNCFYCGKDLRQIRTHETRLMTPDELQRFKKLFPVYTKQLNEVFNRYEAMVIMDYTERARETDKIHATFARNVVGAHSKFFISGDMHKTPEKIYVNTSHSTGHFGLYGEDTFCNKTCAMNFGRHAAFKGWRLK